MDDDPKVTEEPNSRSRKVKRSLKDEQAISARRPGSLNVIKNGSVSTKRAAARDKSSSSRPFVDSSRVKNGADKAESSKFKKKMNFENIINDSRPESQAGRMEPEELAGINSLVNHHSPAHPSQYNTVPPKIDRSGYGEAPLSRKEDRTLPTDPTYSSPQKKGSNYASSPAITEQKATSSNKKLHPGVAAGPSGFSKTKQIVSELDESFEFEEELESDFPEEPPMKYLLDSFRATKKLA